MLYWTVMSFADVCCTVISVAVISCTMYCTVISFFCTVLHVPPQVSPAAVTYMAMELIENDAAHPDLTQELDW